MFDPVSDDLDDPPFHSNIAPTTTVSQNPEKQCGTCLAGVRETFGVQCHMLWCWMGRAVAYGAGSDIPGRVSHLMCDEKCSNFMYEPLAVPFSVSFQLKKCLKSNRQRTGKRVTFDVRWEVLQSLKWRAKSHAIRRGRVLSA